jgi:hypothetical protein
MFIFFGGQYFSSAMTIYFHVGNEKTFTLELNNLQGTSVMEYLNTLIKKA